MLTHAKMNEYISALTCNSLFDIRLPGDLNGNPEFAGPFQRLSAAPFAVGDRDKAQSVRCSRSTVYVYSAAAGAGERAAERITHSAASREPDHNTVESQQRDSRRHKEIYGVRRIRDIVAPFELRRR